MSEFDSSESLEAPKVKGVRKSRAPKVQVEEGANGPAKFDLSFLDEELLDIKEEEPVAPKRGKGRPKKVKEPVDEDDYEPSPPKPRRKQSEAQKQNFIKALEARKKNIELRKAAKELERQIKEEEQEAKKKEVERKIVKKAVCIKKKQVLAEASLDEVSDCDVPDEIVEKIIKTQRAKKVVQPKPKPVEPVAPPAPKYNFV